MSHPLTPFHGSFAFNEWLFDSAVKALNESNADRRLSNSTNTPRGIAVHLVVSRHSLLRLLGADIPELPWKDVGEKFEAGFKVDGEKPRLDVILQSWDRLKPVLADRMHQTPQQILTQASPMPVPGVPNATVTDFAKLNVIHESYHLGQLGLLVKDITGKGIMTPPEKVTGA